MTISKRAYERTISAAQGDNPGPVAATLSRQQQEDLLLAARASTYALRDVVVVLMALKAGIGAREQVRMDVRHVATPQTCERGQYVLVRRRPKTLVELPVGAVPIPRALSAELANLVSALRTRCRHQEGRFGTELRTSDGIVICCVCRDPIDFSRTPLLLSRKGQRLSERQLHKIMANLRRRAGLSGEITFKTLTRTHDQELRRIVAAAVWAQELP